MPTYDYYCSENGREIAVFHAMSVRITTWGELCDWAVIDVGDTARETPVERQIGTGIILTRNDASCSGPGCCGTNGCGD
ncbi:MAG: zinc ribbon domain-containing protein [Phycisphaerae bacterium]